jgi:predicted TIM-barrel fold metal-dependent hydrolase
VVVQPSTYGIDNRCLVDALGQLGSASRGVAVVDTDVKDAELRTLTDAGVRAIRVNFVSPQTWGTTIPEMLTTLAKRVSPFGWHVQILMTGDQIVTHESVIRSLSAKVVIDHLGRIPQPDGIKHPAFAAVRRLLDEGRTWVKVTEPYEDSKLGPPYVDSSEVARLCAGCAGARFVGHGLAASHPTRYQAERCLIARSTRRLGTRRAHTLARLRRKPSTTVRLLKVCFHPD